MKKITFPSGVDLEVALELSRTIAMLQPGTQVLFDFSKIRWIGPFGMVLLSTCIEDAARRLGQGYCFATGHENQSYMAHMGFFRVFGLNHGNRPGQASGSSTYRPITDFDCNPFYQMAAQGGVPLGEQMEEEAKRMSSVLIQSVDGDLYDTLSFAVREMLRNALEHSQTKVIRVCAQYWKSKDQVEVAILDHGRGIKESLSRNPFIKCESDRQALNFALMPGVSGTAFKGSQRQRDDMWQNSGYGLYMTSRICRLGGSFFIGSNEDGLSLSSWDSAPNGKTYHKFGFPGTCVRLIIKPSQVSNLSSRLKQFSLEGRVLAGKIAGTVLEASTASQMVTSDYQ